MITGDMADEAAEPPAKRVKAVAPEDAAAEATASASESALAPAPSEGSDSKGPAAAAAAAEPAPAKDGDVPAPRKRPPTLQYGRSVVYADSARPRHGPAQGRPAAPTPSTSGAAANHTTTQVPAQVVVANIISAVGEAHAEGLKRLATQREIVEATEREVTELTQVGFG